MPTLRSHLRAVWHFARLARDPTRFDDALGLLDDFVDDTMLVRGLEDVSSTEHGRVALNERKRLPRLRPEDLTEHAPGTLGHAVAGFVRANGIDMADLPVKPAPDQASYLLAHLYDTHDIWHVVTGFGTDVAGELGLQAFYLAQLPSLHLSWSIIAVGAVNTMLFESRDGPNRIAAIARGHQLGQHMQSLWGVDWRARFDQPLEQLRRELGHPDLAANDGLGRREHSGRAA